MSIVTSKKKQCTIMDDININLLNFENHLKTEYYLEGLLSNGFVPIIVKPTRITGSSATLIDHMYTNNITATDQATIIITDLADHFGTFYLTKLHNTSNSHVKKARKRIFSDSNIEIFRSKLKDIDFTNISLTMCSNDAYNEL